MNYIKIGDTVFFGKWIGEIVREVKKDSRKLYLVQFDNGDNVYVNPAKIKWNGKEFFVTMEGVRESKALAEVELFITSIEADLEVIDSKTDSSMERTFYREKVKHEKFVEWLGYVSGKYGNRELGIIIKEVIGRMKNI